MPELEARVASPSYLYQDRPDERSILLARDKDRSARLLSFTDTFVDQDELEYDGQSYGYTRISAIGDNGSMLHIRLARQTLHERLDPARTNLAIITHIDDPGSPTFLFATSEDVRRTDGSVETTFTLGQPDEPRLLVVPDGMSEQELELERSLARYEASLSVPLVRMNGNGWKYRRSDSHWEELHDIKTVQRRVSSALAAGLGSAALPVRLNDQSDTGHIEQKVLV